MKAHIFAITCALAGFALTTVNAQPPGGRGMGGPPPGPNFSGALSKLFGDNKAFSATMEMHTSGGPSGSGMTIPGKIAFSDGKSRFEMDMTEVKGGSIPPQAMTQMRAMGMDKVVRISRPDKKTMYA